MDCTDQPTAIRPGEDLDQERLESWLKDSLPGLDGPLSIQQFPSGHSNLTYLIQVGKKQMVLRRPPFGTKPKNAHDMTREYKILKALKPVFPYVPQPLAHCNSNEVMGCAFYVMERMDGIILRREIPPQLNLSRIRFAGYLKNMPKSSINCIHWIMKKSAWQNLAGPQAMSNVRSAGGASAIVMQKPRMPRNLKGS